MACIQHKTSSAYMRNWCAGLTADIKELNSAMYRTMGPNIEVQGAILTPQSVAEVVGMIPSPQEEDRYVKY